MLLMRVLGSFWNAFESCLLRIEYSFQMFFVCFFIWLESEKMEKFCMLKVNNMKDHVRWSNLVLKSYLTFNMGKGRRASLLQWG